MAGRVSSRRDRRRAWIAAGLLVGVAVILGVMIFAPWGCRPSRGGGPRVVRMAVRQWRVVTNSNACPAYTELIDAGLLDPGVSRHAGSDFRIDCLTDEVSVLWAGPDRQFQTPDDEMAPDPLGNMPRLRLAALGAAALDVFLLPLSLCGIAILATFRRWPWATSARRVASLVGWLVILGSLCAGFSDLIAARAFAAHANLSRIDAGRCRRRGIQNLLYDAAVGIVLGTPGAVLVPFPLRRRVRQSFRKASPK